MPTSLNAERLRAERRLRSLLRGPSGCVRSKHDAFSPTSPHTSHSARGSTRSQARVADRSLRPAHTSHRSAHQRNHCRARRHVDLGGVGPPLSLVVIVHRTRSYGSASSSSIEGMSVGTERSSLRSLSWMEVFCVRVSRHQVVAGLMVLWPATRKVGTSSKTQKGSYQSLSYDRTMSKERRTGGTRRFRRDEMTASS